MLPSHRTHVRQLAAALAFTLAATILPGSNVQPTVAVSPDIVVSQVYGGGGNSGATYTNDFVELFNRGSSAASLAGWSVQYASATGTGNFGANSGQLTELPSVTLQPGQYFLVQEASTAAVGSPLPTPDLADATPINLSATAGKVIVADTNVSIGCNGGSTPCAASALASIVDLVGYGTANFFEGATPAPAASNTTSDARAGAGCTDTDQNGTDFAAGTPAARTTATAFHVCAGDEPPTVLATSPADGSLNVDVAANVTVTFSEPVVAGAAAFAISCTESGSHAAILSGGPTTFSLDPDADFASSESCTVTILGADVTDQDTNDPPDAMAADYVFDFTTTTGCGDPATPIHDIQGRGATSPLAGQAVEIEGVVVGDFQLSTSFNGFHVQEEDADADAEPATSEGVFVFEGGSNVDVAAGDVVRVAGTVSEFNSSGTFLTEVSSVTRVLVCSSGASVTPAVLSLPFTDTAFPERYEGMLVETTQDLTVSETFSLGRFGELVLSSGGRLLNPTNVVEPGAPAQALQAANDRNRIVLDDGDNRQNIDPTLYPAGGLAADHTLRVGDTVEPGRFVLEQRFGVYRLQPVGTVQIQDTNPRPAAPAEVGGNLRVAALNVLNYFTTLDTGPTGCGPTGTLECRGANTTFELDRQRAKTVAEILGLDADVLGLMEVQNDTGATLQDLVGALNAATAPGTYAYIDTGTIGTDAIKVALLYRPASVTPAGAYAILDHTVDARFRDTFNRPALAQTFDAVGGGRLTVVVNHLKSKGSNCNAVGDPDIGDGQGNCNQTRTLAAEALADWVATDPTHSGDRDVLLVGDMNSYAQEDPIDVFRGAGFTNLVDAFLGGEGYSYVFQGQTGYLDHALASPTLAAQVTGTTEWHVNADEPTVLDYNTEFKSAGQVAAFYAPDAYRSSDHDPLVVGIQLLDYGFTGFFSPVDNPPVVNTVRAGQAVPVKFALDGDLGLDVLFGAPTAAAYTCASGDPMDEVESTVTSGDSGLTFDPSTGTYTYTWKTDKAWADQCRVFTLTLDDGAYRSANLQFRR
jgi:predicted extracellular nuclease